MLKQVTGDGVSYLRPGDSFTVTYTYEGLAEPGALTVTNGATVTGPELPVGTMVKLFNLPDRWPVERRNLGCPDVRPARRHHRCDGDVHSRHRAGPGRAPQPDGADHSDDAHDAADHSDDAHDAAPA